MKNIVGCTRDKIMKKKNNREKKGLVLHVSYDDYIIGSNIKSYLNRKHWKMHTTTLGEEEDSYSFEDDAVSAWCDTDGIIHVIICNKTCIYNGVELIGMKFSDFIDIIQEQPYYHDIIYLEGKVRGQNQHVYEFDKCGLQVWTWRNRIRTIILGDESEDDTEE